MKQFLSILFLVVGFSVLNARSTNEDSLMAVYNNQQLPIEERLLALHWVAFDATYRKPDSALAMINKYIDFAAEVDDSDSYLLGLHYRGKYYKQRNKYEKAIACFLFGLKESEKANNIKRMGHFLVNLGTVEEELGDLQTATQWYKKGLSVVAGKNCKEVEARCLMNIGNIEKIWGNHIAALRLFHQALDLCVENAYNGYLPFLKQSMGDVYFSIADYKQALVFYTESVEASKKQSNVNRLIYALNKSSETYLALNQYKKAETIVQEAIALCTKYGLKRNEAIARNTLTQIYIATQQLADARQQNSTAMKLCSEEDAAVLKNSYLNYAQILVQLGNIAEAEKYSKKSLNIALAQNDVELASSNYWQLYTIAKLQKDYKTALYYEEKHTAIKSKLMNAQNVRMLSLQEAQYSFDKKLYKDSLAHENEQRQKAIDYQATLNKKDNELIIVSVLGVVFLMVAMGVLYAFYNNRKKNLKLAEKQVLIEQKSSIIQNALEEKELLLQEIHHRVKNNLQVISSLLELQAANVENKEVEQLLLTGQSRVKTMALIHQKLYENDTIGIINVEGYITELVNYLKSVYTTQSSVNTQLNCQAIELDIDTAIPLGLIVNELVSNSLKHAFEGNKAPQITLAISEQGADSYVMAYKDNGVGFDEAFDYQRSKSLGMRLVYNLSKQLMGEALVKSSKKGCHIEIYFRTKAFRKQTA